MSKASGEYGERYQTFAKQILRWDVAVAKELSEVSECWRETKHMERVSLRGQKSFIMTGNTGPRCSSRPWWMAPLTNYLYCTCRRRANKHARGASWGYTAYLMGSSTDLPNLSVLTPLVNHYCIWKSLFKAPEGAGQNLKRCLMSQCEVLELKNAFLKMKKSQPLQPSPHP